MSQPKPTLESFTIIELIDEVKRRTLDHIEKLKNHGDHRPMNRQEMPTEIIPGSCRPE